MFPIHNFVRRVRNRRLSTIKGTEWVSPTKSGSTEYDENYYTEYTLGNKKEDEVNKTLVFSET